MFGCICGSLFSSMVILILICHVIFTVDVVIRVVVAGLSCVCMFVLLCVFTVFVSSPNLLGLSSSSITRCRRIRMHSHADCPHDLIASAPYNIERRPQPYPHRLGIVSVFVLCPRLGLWLWSSSLCCTSLRLSSRLRHSLCLRLHVQRRSPRCRRLRPRGHLHFQLPWSK